MRERGGAGDPRGRQRRELYYYNYYTDQYWEDMENYDLCLDTAAFDREQLLDILAKVYEQI
ncbi:MAG: hypothetical protein ACLTLQ_04265 [[Clostridium] scindens]